MLTVQVRRIHPGNWSEGPYGKEEKTYFRKEGYLGRAASVKALPCLYPQVEGSYPASGESDIPHLEKAGAVFDQEGRLRAGDGS